MTFKKNIAIFVLFTLFILSSGPGFAGNFRSAMEEADAYMNNGQYLEALGAYQDLAERAYDTEMKAKAILRIGDIYSYFLDNHDKALELYDQLKKRYPRSSHAANAYFNTGMILYEKSRYKEALKQFKTYVDQYPGENRKDAAIFMMEACSRPRPDDMEKQKVFQTSESRDIRVLLLSGVRETRIEASSMLELDGMDEGEAQMPLTTVHIVCANGDILVNSKKIPREVLIIKSVTGDLLRLNGAPYRGSLKVQKNPKGGVDVLNILPLEDYLYGVVPKEMSPLWFPEALKAQAVAARTYALYVMEKSKGRDYDVLPTTASQVYGGFAVETERSNRAVDETRGTVLLYRNQPVLAYFHANSGGVTEDARQVWAAEIPYLKSIQDHYSLKAPGCTWKRTIDLEDIRKALNKSKVDVGYIERIACEGITPSGRITKIRIVHGDKETVMSGNDFRVKIDPVLIKSTSFTATHQGREVSLEGKGYGHGVGMSQWGAYVMAREGHSFRDILQFYYQGVEITRLK
ncbi:MAG: Cell division coordinator CpoB [Syntrophus sp. SKADARSKE-3]|nr:Cell division coordinator CpoB [Syntrophus sp. SKADARSKE-3]